MPGCVVLCPTFVGYLRQDHSRPRQRRRRLLADYARVEAIALAIALRRTAIPGSAEIELAVHGLRRACCWLCPLLA
jgi:hypothetical protein